MSERQLWSIPFLLAALPLIGCNLSTTASDGGLDGGNESDDGGPMSVISGDVDEHPFMTVGAAYWIGKAPDGGTTVVMFSNPITCAEISSHGWIGSITDNTAVLEMQTDGTSDGTYDAPSASSSTFVVATGSATPTELSASSGHVQLSGVVPSSEAIGTFLMTFSDGSLAGTFYASYCADGTPL